MVPSPRHRAENLEAVGDLHKEAQLSQQTNFNLQPCFFLKQEETGLGTGVRVGNRLF
jgi:hypothetical protein